MNPEVLEAKEVASAVEEVLGEAEVEASAPGITMTMVILQEEVVLVLGGEAEVVEAEAEVGGLARGIMTMMVILQEV